MIRLACPVITRSDCEEVCRILRSGRLVQGEVVQAFERALADHLGVSHVAAVSSGTAALWVALRALGVGPGDAVIAPAFTFPATINVIELNGARPVLVDVDPQTCCMDPDQVALVIRRFRGPGRLAAIVPVHEFGAPCAMDQLAALAKEAGLAIVEDAACALGTTFAGRKAGTFGQAGCFSFHPRKALTTGEGGCVATNDPKVYEEVILLRNHGLKKSGEEGFDLVAPGLNWRMTEFQASLGLSQLQRFKTTLEARKHLASCYLDGLRGVPGLLLPADVSGHVWQTFMVVLPEHLPRARVIRELRDQGIEAGVGAYAVHTLSYYRHRYQYRLDDFPVAYRLHTRGLALPLHEALQEEDVVKVIQALRKICSG